MTALDWLGLLGIVMTTGVILLAALILTAAIVRDICRALELRNQSVEDVDRELAEVISPFARRQLHVLPGGRDPGAAA